MRLYEILALLLQFAYLTVGENLRIIPEKKIQNKFVGTAFFVGCESTGKNVERLMWTGPEGQQITNYLERIHVEDGKTGHKGVDLVFENVTRTDKGTYTCSAKVDGREVQKSFELKVFKRIVFLDTPVLQYLEEGSDSPLRCNVDGDPAPKVNWRAPHQKPIKPQEGTKHTKHPDSPNWVVIKNATLNDAGTYICSARQVSNEFSDMKHLEIEVKVRHKPLGTPEHINQSYSYVSGVANLTCEVIAEPHANFTWLKDDTVIVPSENIKIFNEDQNSYLQLKVEDEEMFGDYICKAQNRLGTLERVVTLQQGVKPTAPHTKVRKVNVNEFHLNLTSESQPEMPITGYKVEYKRPGEDWKQASAREFKYGEPYILDGLHSDTLYVMRVSSRNIAGYSDYSKDMMERTKKATPIQQQMSLASRFSAPYILYFSLTIFLCCTVCPVANTFYS